jgi:hypothetical protein
MEEVLKFKQNSKYAFSLELQMFFNMLHMGTV